MFADLFLYALFALAALVVLGFALAPIMAATLHFRALAQGGAHV